MDKKKLKEIIAIVIVGIVSIVSSVLACILGVPKDAIDNVINDVGFVEIFDPSFEESEEKEAEKGRQHGAVADPRPAAGDYRRRSFRGL